MLMRSTLPTRMLKDSTSILLHLAWILVGTEVRRNWTVSLAWIPYAEFQYRNSCSPWLRIHKALHTLAMNGYSYLMRRKVLREVPNNDVEVLMYSTSDVQGSRLLNAM